MPRRCLWSVTFPQMQQETELVGSSKKHNMAEEQQRIFEKRIYTQASDPPTSPYTQKSLSDFSAQSSPVSSPPLSALSTATCNLRIRVVLRWQIKSKTNKYLKQMHF